jgi:hypothetical protein
VLARHRARLAVNLANGSTLAGLAVAAVGRARLARGPSGLLVATGYRLPVPAVPAFTMGSVILTRMDTLPADSALFRHEARHTTQYAWCGGLLMLPTYFAAAGASWVLCGDFGAWNVYERTAGLTDGGYQARPLRWARGLQQARRLSGSGRRAGDPEGELPGGTPAGRAGSAATPSP